MTTTSYGTYSFGNLPTPGKYKVTPSKTHYTFSPAQLTLTTSRAGVDFTGTLKTHTVSGRVTLSGTTTGIQSSFQSLGLNHPKWSPILAWGGRAYAIVVCGGFILLAVWAYFQHGGIPQ